jgi:phosphoserine phosphatase
MGLFCQYERLLYTGAHPLNTVKPVKNLYFVRHGETEWNAIRRMQGQWNSNLNEKGQRQADINGRLLQKLNIEALFASPLDRTRQTADIINQYLSLPIQFDERIMEWDCGDWSGFLYKEIQEQWPQEWAALEADRFFYRGPDCENYPDMIARSLPFLEELKAHPADNIAIVSHGMIGKTMVSTLLDFTPEQTLSFSQSNDMVFQVTLVDDRVSVQHYLGGDGPFEGHTADASEQPV